MTAFVTPDRIRSLFAQAMSDMYRTEVPLYGDLIDLVGEINDATLQREPALAARLARNAETERLDLERHGAIRVGTPAELAMLGRVFALMGMHPVGYYDLTVAGVPTRIAPWRSRSRRSVSPVRCRRSARAASRCSVALLMSPTSVIRSPYSGTSARYMSDMAWANRLRMRSGVTKAVMGLGGRAAWGRRGCVLSPGARVWASMKVQ